MAKKRGKQMKKTKVIHQFLNEPEIIKAADVFEALLVPTTLLQYVLGVLGNSKFIVTGTVSFLFFTTFFKVRRPIQRTNKKGLINQ